jgi:hypothetical protein
MKIGNTPHASLLFRQFMQKASRVHELTNEQANDIIRVVGEKLARAVGVSFGSESPLAKSVTLTAEEMLEVSNILKSEDRRPDKELRILCDYFCADRGKKYILNIVESLSKVWTLFVLREQLQSLVLGNLESTILRMSTYIS